MLILTNSGTDKLQVTTDTTATVDVVASWVDSTGVAGSAVTPGNTGTAIVSATTTDVVATPASSTFRNVKSLTIRNKSATLTSTVAVILNKNGASYELHKATLATGDVLQFIEGVGFFQIAATSKLFAKLRVAADVTNATTSFADITGLTQALLSGKKYCFEACLFHQTNATTTGAQYGVNIGAAPTALVVWGDQQITSSVTAATFGSSAAVTARDTAAVVETTGPGAATFGAYLAGYIQPSADGTFAIRGASEVAVAGGLVTKTGSWCNIWETDN